MIADYAPNGNLPLLQTKAAFKAATPGEWNTTRSNELAVIGRSLDAFSISPTVGNLTLVRNATNAWLNAKVGRFNAGTGAITSIRAAGVTALRQQLATLHTLHTERDTAMHRIAGLLDALDWRRRALCAELYDHDLNLGAVDAHKGALKLESIYSSGWARLIPDPAPIDFWDDGGGREIARLAAWPALGMAAKIRMNSDNGGVDVVWPPWANPHVRKGVFCHSAAAIAVNVILANLVPIQAGLGQWRIRSIDVIHQKPPGHGPDSGGMTHWWVAINRPNSVTFGTRVHQFNGRADFSVLPLVGGFVVDVWGAMWVDQQHHQNVWATSNLPTPAHAVAFTPFITLVTPNDPVKIYTHELY